MSTNAFTSARIRLLQAILQGLLALIFLVASALNLSGQMNEDIAHLGYPEYFTTIIGVAYILGVLGIYQPRIRFLQDWAYGAMTAALVGAAGSHILAGDPIGKAAPAIFTLTVLALAYALRIQARALPSVAAPS